MGQEKIAKLSEYATDFDAKEYKQQVVRLVTARSTKTAKLQALQLANDNPETTPEIKAKLQNDYNVAAADELVLAQSVESDDIAMYVVPESVGDSAVDTGSFADATATVAVLLAALCGL